jgi:hypothetical protein
MNLAIRKWFWIWQQDQEKKFLEEQAKKAYVLIEVKVFKYIFDKRETKNLIYQMDFRGLGGKISQEEYLQIYEDAGWTSVPSGNGWYYFYQEAKSNVNLSLFNDFESQRKAYIRLIGFLALIGFPLYFYIIYAIPNLQVSGFFTRVKLALIIIVVVIAFIHLISMIKIYHMYKKLKKNIKE